MRYTGSSPSDPPSEWAGADALGGDVYWMHNPDAPDVLRSILVWHWCPRLPRLEDAPAGRWIAAGVATHTLVSVEPLHLEPSLLWECCGKHGWVRDGAWVDA